MAAIGISTATTEFGQTFANGQVATDLTPLQALAMVQSGLGRYVNSDPQTLLPPVGVVPITSIQFLNPTNFGPHSYPDRQYEFNGVRYYWGGQSLVGLGLGGEVTVAVSAAEVLTLNATPKQIIAAPPAGFAVVVNRVAVYKPVGTAYSGLVAAKDLVLKYTGASGAQAASVIEATGFLDQATAQNRIAFPTGSSGAVPGDITPVAGAPVVLHMLGGEVTTGNSPLYVRVRYDVVQLNFTT